MALKEIVLFRHAQKGSWTNDPELSEQGHRQALLIVELVHRELLPRPHQLLTSPKKRAQQTLIPLQEEFQIPLIIEPTLDERNSYETGREFEARIKSFVQEEIPQQQSSCLFMCTHLDWLEVFSWAAPLIVDISSDILDIPPAHYYHFELDKDQKNPWKLVKKGGVS